MNKCEMTEGISINAELESIIKENKVGSVCSKWGLIRKDIPTKITQTITDHYKSKIDAKIEDPIDPLHVETIESSINKISTYLTTNFSEAPPFTIIRLSEILLNPIDYYSTPEKFLRALEAVVYVRTSYGGREIQTDAESQHTNGSSKVKETGITKTLNGSENPSSFAAAVESQTILLSKIDWLTDDDLKEIESETYLLDEFPLSEGVCDKRIELDEDFADDEYPLNSEQRKRKVEEDESHSPEEPFDSPEKRFKGEQQPAQTSTKEEVVESENEQRAVAAESGEEVLKETSIDQDKVSSSTDEEDAESQCKRADVSDISIDDLENAGNNTLEEDKMDLD